MFVNGMEHGLAIELAKRKSESPIEHDFWHQMWKTKPEPWQQIESQVTFGRYRVDGLLVFGSERIAIELDGKDFHDRDRDAVRDAALLQHHGLTWVVRIPGYAIRLFPNSTMRVLAEWWKPFEIAWENCVVRATELRAEIGLIRDRYGEQVSDSEFLAEHNDSYDIWDATSSYGYVASPESVLKSWNIRPIIRRRRECLDIG